MAKKENQGRDDEQQNRNVNADNENEVSSTNSDGLHPLEYLEMQENGNLQNYLNPMNEEEEEGQGNPQAMEQQGSGNKGKILTSDGLEYE